MSTEKAKPQSRHVVAMQHRYTKGDAVFLNDTQKMIAGEVYALLPYIFIEPAYYVKIGLSILAVSERSLARFEDVTG